MKNLVRDHGRESVQREGNRWECKRKGMKERQLEIMEEKGIKGKATKESGREREWKKGREHEREREKRGSNRWECKRKGTKRGSQNGKEKEFREKKRNDKYKPQVIKSDKESISYIHFNNLYFEEVQN